ncbi:hypothetical protein O181_074485 [Austropuccinia psidii MF-1]|uniref:Uncharacterized protein n=1 Tax=Austropuccinia psidii MF-1 TaxID=1389203 RepID=A0A9Q3FCH7_9BASI|nr:hypothetical protein [Austropuccinia psidii MF-1]
MEPEREYSDSFRLTRSGKSTTLSSGFKPLRQQQISDQESPYFQIPGNIQYRQRIIGKEQDFFQPGAESVRPYDTEIVGPDERSKKSFDKDPYGWCLRQSKRIIAIDPQMTTEMRNIKLLTKLPGDLEHEVKCRCSKESTLDEISTTLQ